MMTRATLPHLSEICGAVGIFTLLSIPSLKLLYASELVNLLPVPFLALALLLRNARVGREDVRTKMLLVWGAFATILCGLVLISPVVTPMGLIKLWYFLAAVLVVILLADYPVMRGVVVLLVIWGLFLAFWQLLYGVPRLRALGQHYITVAMPIGVAMCIVLVAALAPHVRLARRVGLGVLGVILIAAQASLLSRAAVIFPVMIVATYVVAMLIAPRDVGVRKGAVIGLVACGVAVSAYVLTSIIELRQMYRLVRLVYDLESESRVGIYRYTWELIAQRPIFGHGAGSTDAYFSMYPHNIMLEVLLQGGVFLGAIFSIYLLIFAGRAWDAFRYTPNAAISCGCIAMAAYLFLQWNTSFELMGAYIPLGAMALAAIGHVSWRDAQSRSPAEGL